MTTAMQDAAATASTVIKDVMKVEPMIATGIGMFVPGAAPILAMIQPEVLFAAPYIEQALDAIAKSNGGDTLSALIQLFQHLTAGMPNASALAPHVHPDTVDPSTLGSG